MLELEYTKEEINKVVKFLQNDTVCPSVNHLSIDPAAALPGLKTDQSD